VAPGSYGGFREWWDARLESDEAYLTDEARYVGSAIMFQIPVPPSRYPAMRVHNLILAGSLPPVVRKHYGVRWTPAHALAFRATVTALRAPRPVTPERIRMGRNTPFFDLVARTEKSRYARGRPIPGALG
jgi:uncharacterized protein (DUF2236 family)